MSSGPRAQPVFYRFTIYPQGPKIKPADLRRLVKQATRNAVRAAQRAGKPVTATTVPEGQFGGVGEAAVALAFLLPKLKLALAAFGTGTAGAAGKMFFDDYLKPRLLKLNLLPAKFQEQPAAESAPVAVKGPSSPTAAKSPVKRASPVKSGKRKKKGR